MTERIFTAKTTPSVVTSPAAEYLPAGWLSAFLELRIWRSTTTNTTLVWAIVVDNFELRLRRVVWTQTRNEATCGYQDVIDAADAPIARSTFLALVTDLAGISFPAFATKQMGLDGESRGIELRGHLQNTTLGWWCGAPASWAEVAAWHAKAEDILEEQLPPIPEHFNIGYRVPKRPRAAV